MTESSYTELNLTDFGTRELIWVRDLLTAYLNRDLNKTELFGTLTKVGFNHNSGSVFLIDDSGSTAMEADGKLYDFITCPECGNEDMLPDFDGSKPCCYHYLRDLGLSD